MCHCGIYFGFVVVGHTMDAAVVVLQLKFPCEKVNANLVFDFGLNSVQWYFSHCNSQK